MKINKARIFNKIPNTVLHLVLIVGSFLMVLPFLWMILSSFKPNLDIISVDFKLFSSNWTLDNYRQVIEKMPIARAYFNSLLIASIVTVTSILSASAGGFLFAKLRFKGRDFIFFIVLASIMIPAQIVLIPLYLMISRIGMVNNYGGLVLPFLINAFSVFLMRQFISGIPNDIIEASRVDGASDWKIYFKIILPLVKPGIAVVGILTFLWTYDEFLWPLVVITSTNMMTLPLILSRYAMAEGGVIAGPAMATTTLILGPILIVYAFFQRFFIKGISMTGMKG